MPSVKIEPVGGEHLQPQVNAAPKGYACPSGLWLQWPCRGGLSTEASLGITVGFDMAMTAASLAFLVRRPSTAIVQWGARKLQPGKEKLEQLRRKQVCCSFAFWTS